MWPGPASPRCGLDRAQWTPQHNFDVVGERHAQRQPAAALDRLDVHGVIPTPPAANLQQSRRGMLLDWAAWGNEAWPLQAVMDAGCSTSWLCARLHQREVARGVQFVFHPPDGRYRQPLTPGVLQTEKRLCSPALPCGCRCHRAPGLLGCTSVVRQRSPGGRGAHERACQRGDVRRLHSRERAARSPPRAGMADRTCSAAARRRQVVRACRDDAAGAGLKIPGGPV